MLPYVQLCLLFVGNWSALGAYLCKIVSALAQELPDVHETYKTHEDTFFSFFTPFFWNLKVLTGGSL